MTTERRQQHPQQQSGFFANTLSAASRLLIWLLVALFFSVLTEWVGMSWWWPDKGLDHSREMLEQEIQYLNRDFHRSMVTSRPAAYARRFADTSYHYAFEATGIVRVLAWLAQAPRPGDASTVTRLRNAYAAVQDYVLAAMAITQVFALRLAILTLAAPVFLLTALVAVTDGLVQRELRRWGGGRESSFVYHHAKRLVYPSFLMAGVVYLAMPVSVHPNFIILPFAALNAVAIAVTASSFKKYL